MIGNNLISVRLGGIQALRNIALEHSDEYQQEVRDLLAAYYSSHGSEGRTIRTGKGMLAEPTAHRARQLEEREEREQRESQLEEEERQKAILAIDEHEKRLS